MNICYAYSSNRGASRKILNKLCEKKQKPKKVENLARNFLHFMK